MYRARFVLRLCHQNVCASPQTLQRVVCCTSQKSFVQSTRFLIYDAGVRKQKTSSTSGTAAAPPRKKTKELTKITLLQGQGQGQALSVSTLEDAQKLAKRRDLHLIQVEEFDSKTGRAVYKLVTSAEMLAQELDEGTIAEQATGKGAQDKSQKKSEKLLTIGSRITEHDLSSRLNHIAKWLSKRHEVRILIQGKADDVNCERIFKTIETSIKEPQVIGKIVQKRAKGAAIKFNILPVSNNSPTS